MLSKKAVKALTESARRDPAPVALVIGALGSGGAERVATLLIGAWLAEGRTVHLITFDDSATDFYPVPAEVNRIVTGNPGKSSNPLVGLLSNFRRVRRLRKALRATGAQSILSFITSMNVLTILASFGLGMRVVISERNDPMRQDPGTFWRVLRRLCYPMADVVTANTAHAIEVMSEYVPRHKLAMVPNPVQIPISPAKPDSARTLINVGRLVPQKGQVAIVSAFARLSNEFTDWRLVVVGDGPERRNIERRSMDEGVASRVILPGTVPDPSGYYESAGIFVMASHYEGTPNTLMEAMAYGLPCVVPDCLPGALEHVEDGVSGLVFRSEDPGDLVRCLSLLMNDPDLRTRLGNEARGRMKAYSTERVAKQWDQLLFSARSFHPRETCE